MMERNIRFIYLLIFGVVIDPASHAFNSSGGFKFPQRKLLFSSASSDQGMKPIESMPVSELKAELKERNVNYSDCFDKESLAKKLQRVRENPPSPAAATAAAAATSSSDSDREKKVASPAKKSFDRDAKLSELRTMKVKSLREQCAKRKIRWAQFVEKEDLVQALIQAMENSADFSVSGVMVPGEVTDLTGEELEQELSQPSEAPLLLDIYATWCGPCQMMAPQLKEAAVELGDRVRVGKIDSDKHPAMAQKLKAAGLPTVLVLNGSEELQRIEGALMKDQILQFVEPYI